MIALKKLYGDELLRLALVLSLLKADPSDYLETETQQLITGLHISNGSDWSLEHEAQTFIRPRFIHPKSLDNVLINYERELFEELNSLGRYGRTYNVEYNDRIWNNRRPVLHTYLVNNVATDTVVPALAPEPLGEEASQDGVPSDDNVAQEVKVEDQEQEVEQEVEISTSQILPDAVVTLSADFLSNRSESDIFDEILSRSFDVNEFLIPPAEMQIKKEQQGSEESNLMDVEVKIERDDGDLYSDNAMDDFVPYFAKKSSKLELEEPNVIDENMADLQDYSEMLEEVKEFKPDFEHLDAKYDQEDLEKYLIENTHLDSEVYELAPMFEEELVLDVKRERASTSFTSASSSGVSEMDVSSVGNMTEVKMEPDEGHHTGDELTQEDMDLIEVLWKQDVDMGFSLEDPVQPNGPKAIKVHIDEIDKELKLAEEKLQKKNVDATEEIEKVKSSLLNMEPKEDDPWAGLSYTVDTETGEYVIQGELPGDLVNTEECRFDFLEEALQLVDLGDEVKDEQPPAVEGSSGAMLHPAMRHVPHHPLAHYHNQSLMRSMSVEQRWQDLASLLTIPPPPDQYQHYHHHQHNMSAHGAAGGYAPNYHAAIPPPVPEKHPDPYGVAPSMDGAYKVEGAHHSQQHDALYYQNSTTEMPPPPPTNSDGFLQSILNDEDLQLMDMAMNEGMYTMRMLDGASAHHPAHNHTQMMMTTPAERDSASDSAVSSMGSERVPSLSDGEWCDGNDSAQEFHSSKFRPYEATGYGRDRAAPHQPQKKHHMFGKRCFQEQQTPNLEPLVSPRPSGVVKYECSEQAYQHENLHLHNVEYGRQLGPHVMPPAVDINSPHSAHALLQNGSSHGMSPRLPYVSADRIRHNHTYSAPHPHDTRPAAVRDKRVRRLTDGSASDASSSAGHISRDEKRAKALGIPLDVHEIINLPMDEFNERLSKHDLSEAQLSLIRDIRRRGKNKVAAQNCRKRKLDQITSLADEVRTVRDRKQRTQRDHASLLAERQRLKERFAALYRHVFQNLRDTDGRPLSSAQYSLQQSADGRVVLVPKMSSHDHQLNPPDDEMDRKAKSYDQ